MIKQKIKRLFILLIVLIMGFTFYNTVHATNVNTMLEVVQTSSEQKDLPNDQGFISKAISSSDLENGEVTIELKLSNTAKDIENAGDTEVFLVIDNSPSMDFTSSSGESRKSIILNAAKPLVENIFSNVSNVKVGIVNFHGVSFFSLAGLANASITTELTSNKANVMSGLDKLLNASTESGTNIDAGLQRAEKNFSSTCQNKIIILLTDGLPNADVKGNSSNDKFEGDEFNIVKENTKSTLKRLQSERYYVITMITGIALGDFNSGDPVYSSQEDVDMEQEAVRGIFGTHEHPTVGKFYNVETMNAASVIENDIFNDVMYKTQQPIKEVAIEDFFPQDILDNFTFEYVGSPSLGTVTPNIDNEIKSITWNIDTLKGEEIAILKYKLKIKDMQNEALLNKVISTNEKVVLDYKDAEEGEYQVILTSSPKIKLIEKQEVPINGNDDNKVENNTNQESEDDTVSPNVLPQTGKTMTIIFGITIITTIGIIAIIKHKKYKEI